MSHYVQCVYTNSVTVFDCRYQKNPLLCGSHKKFTLSDNFIRSFKNISITTIRLKWAAC